MQSTDQQGQSNGASASSSNATAVLSALPITVQGVPDNMELANMSIGQLLGHGQRRVSVTQVATVTPVSGGIQILRPVQSGGITMSQAQQQLVSTSTESPSTSRPLVQLRVEGNRILSSSPDLRQTAEPKVTYVTSRTPIGTTQREIRRAPGGELRVPAPVKPQPAVVVSDTQSRSGTLGGTLLDRSRLDDLMKQIDPTSILEDPVKDALLEFIDDFVEKVIDRTCQVAQHRKSEAIEAKDVEYVLDKFFKIPRLPKGTGVADVLKNENEGSYPEKRTRRSDFTAHNQRLSMINKTIKKL